MKRNRTLLLGAAWAAMLLPSASAGLFDDLKNYVKKEVVPTVTGQRPLRIDPSRITVNHHGKKVFEVDGANDSAYIRVGNAATLKSGKLKQRLAEAGAIYAGDYTVMSRVAAEQFQKELAQAQAEVSYSPPPSAQLPDVPTVAGMAPSDPPGKKVIIYNATGGNVSYILNNRVFTVKPESGIEHQSTSGAFYLQYDEGIFPDQLSVGRYFLQNSDLYYFSVSENKLAIRPA